MTLQVLLVDDQALVRAGIRSLLELSGSICVKHECADGQQALDWLAAHSSDAVDAVLMDIRMPVLDGIKTLQAMRELDTSPPVLMLTTFDEHQLVLDAVKSGAKGYLLKDVSLETLVAAVNDVASGKTFIQPAITERLLTGIANNPPADIEEQSLIEPLSNKEQEILRLMAAGCSNREIAVSMFKSEGTIKNQVSSILGKLGVRDRTRAVLKSIELGLI
ncbi:response regulator transcription factor [Alteromonas sp. ASW11-36]|uniref:Response regulator transcription factor n=1 Tax=Alteromonas arenosi TaxID=3055817 RepID=A0ABT7T246_9ALTE|nr:response regulator transcription factor [Alteromonas sp. ASW11-36]MDM7861854.1 response regulator transcription factor [Alteromonas sp. ASW11-36]